MKLTEAQEVLETATRIHIEARIVRTEQGYAVAIPEGMDDLCYILSEYDVNHVETLRAIAATPCLTDSLYEAERVVEADDPLPPSRLWPTPLVSIMTVAGVEGEMHLAELSVARQVHPVE